VPVVVSHWVFVTPPIPNGIRGDVCPEAVQAASATRRLGQAGTPAIVRFKGVGNGQAFAVDQREVST
jgi:hypothetical protein